MHNPNKCIISLGSNRQKEYMIKEATKILASFFNNIIFSTPIITSPVPPTLPAADFLNSIAISSTDKSFEEIQAFLKKTEEKLGRKPTDKANYSIPIDIDILQWNDDILKNEELNRSYVQKGISEIMKHS